MMSSNKAAKQRYNQILKDPGRRDSHFGPGGALGSEKEGRSRMDQLRVTVHNHGTRASLNHDKSEEVDKKLEALKSGGKIKL